MLIHKGAVYKKAEAPRWVQKLQQGVSPDVKTSHSHLLNDLAEAKRAVEKLLQEHGKVVFDDEHYEALSQIPALLERYNYPLTLIEVKEDDIILF